MLLSFYVTSKRDWCCPLQVYNLTYSPRVGCSDGTAPTFSLAQPQQSLNGSALSLPLPNLPSLLPGWLLLVGIDSPTDVPTLEPRETDVVRRSDEIDPRTIPPFIPLALPHPYVQSPGVDITVIVDTAFWCFALICKPLAKPRDLRTGDQGLSYKTLPPFKECMQIMKNSTGNMATSNLSG